MRLTRLVPLCLLLLACGDDSKSPDAGVRVDASMDDAPPDGPMVIPCGYTETSDANNDDLLGSGTAEATSITFGTETTAICGTFNNGHFMTNNQNIDVDSFMVNVPAQMYGMLYLTAPGAEVFESAVVELYNMTTGTSELGTFAGTFAVAAGDLPSGDYVITVRAYDSADAPAPLDYKVTLKMDSATRCPKSTAVPFVEANEGNVPTTGGLNDVYEIRYTGSPPRGFTVLNDIPENTNITVAAGMSYHITGESTDFTADPVSWMDSFQDRDTYSFSTGPTTNQLTIRLNWPGTTADLDFFLFPMGGIIERANGWDNSNMEEELTTLAVLPNTTYWLFVGADDGSTGQPIDYDVTLCGDAVAP